MSDIQCAATLLIAREAEADEAADGLSPSGRTQAGALARSLRGRHLSTIYSSAATSAVQTAEIVDAELDVPLLVREGLTDDLPSELESIVDLHRGETVLVVTGGGPIRQSLPPLLNNVVDRFGAEHEVASCGVVEVSADGDGWVLRSWSGERA
jgi:2,3-bisphosphoglycerate-dependent phosphoglycerate mutase